MARVPNTASLEHIVGPSVTAKLAGAEAEQRAFLEEVDRRIEAVKRRRHEGQGSKSRPATSTPKPEPDA